MLRALAAAALALLAVRRGAGAQPQESERASVTQVLAGTTIRVDYSRPVARGRDSLFGRVVRWNGRWTPGANWATTLEIDRDLLVEGQPLAKGRYSVWAIPRPARWTLTLHRRARRFHTEPPDSTDVALRVEVRPDSGPHTEVLTWDFPALQRDSATLRLRWGPVVVPLRLAALLPPTPVLATAEARAPYLGTYVERFLDPATGQLEPGGTRVEVVAMGDTLRLRRVPTDPRAPPPRGMDLVPAGAHRFFFTYLDRGRAWVEREVAYEFTVVGGRASGFELVRDDGVAISRARRAP